MNHRQFKTKVIVRFMKRDGGGLRAECDEVRGFFLSGDYPRAVMRDVVPALKLLVQANLDIPVTVSPLGYGIYRLTETNRADLDPPLEIEAMREYVIEREAA